MCVCRQIGFTPVSKFRRVTGRWKIRDIVLAMAARLMNGCPRKGSPAGPWVTLAASLNSRRGSWRALHALASGMVWNAVADWNRRLRSRDWNLEQRPGHSNLYCKMSPGFQASPYSLPEKSEMGHAIASHFTKWAYLKTLAEQPLKDEFPQFFEMACL